jgi:hypothetical protein
LNSAADTVTGVTVNAPSSIGVELFGKAGLTDSTVNGEEALELDGGTVRRTTLNGAGVGLRAVSMNASLVSDSVVTSSRDGGDAVLAAGGPGGPLALRNVTAVASGRSSTGLHALSAGGAGQIGGAIDARNVIARGTANGAFGEPETASGCGGPCAPGEVTLGYSNVNHPSGVIDATSVGHNQSADPLLVNPVVGPGQDFHIARASSPLIGAGTPDPSDGLSDRDGVAHPDPPSIGAYEYAGPPAPAPAPLPVPGNTAPAGGSGVGAAALVPAGASSKPTISQLAETNAVFAVARTATPLHGRTAAASRSRGTIFSFRLDRPATVTVVITTSAKCRRTTARAPRNLRCSQTVAKLTRTAHAGLNQLGFSGRIRGRPLKPRAYRAVFVATNPGGSSAQTTLHFRIVAR